MAVKLTKTITTARVLVVNHVIVGFLLVCFGIREYVLETPTVCFMYMGIWTGIWVSRIGCSRSGFLSLYSGSVNLI